tara:strand:+ start:244 stop:495 length:252 start_codon:yes stop_codon:yes gene_type:complete
MTTQFKVEDVIRAYADRSIEPNIYTVAGMSIAQAVKDKDYQVVGALLARKQFVKAGLLTEDLTEKEKAIQAEMTDTIIAAMNN